MRVITTSRLPSSVRRCVALLSVGLLQLAFAVFGILGITGCRSAFPVEMKGEVVTRLPPDHTACPVAQRVIPMDHPPGCDPCCQKIAIIDVDGMLLNRNFKGIDSMGENPVALFHEKLAAAARDPAIRGVLIRLNSPGGSVTACDLMQRDLLQFRQRTGKPVVTCILDVGAGGAYYLATASDMVFAHPTSVIGGVGVIINIYNMADTLEQYNVQPTPIRGGEHIDVGSPIVSLSEDGEAILKNIAEEFHQRFKDAVLRSRPNVPSDELDGRVFTSTHAVKNGYIDDVLYFDEAIAHTKVISGVSDAARVVMFRRSNDRALTEFDITPNTPSALASIPISLPGLDRASLPHFLYLWQPDPGLESSGY